MANLLTSVSTAIVYLTTNVVHPVFFPYPIAPSLHAARVSIAYQNNVRKEKIPLTWGVYIAGYLIMAWGGGVVSSVLMGVPPPQIYSIHPYLNYVAVHLLLTAFFKAFPAALEPKTLDTILFPLDAVLRVNAITSALAILGTSAVDPKLQTSVLFHFIIGCVASSGGGVTGATLGVWKNEWTLGTPVFLRGVGAIGTLDVWTGGLAALLYNVLTLHPETYAAGSQVLLSLKPVVSTFSGIIDDVPKAVDLEPLQALQAKSITVVMLTALYAWRVYHVHWAGPVEAKLKQVAAAPSSTPNKLPPKKQIK